MTLSWLFIMKILVIGGSNSRNSINRQFAQYAASLFENATTELVDISQLDLPLFSVDLESAEGIHPIAVDFAQKIDQSDFLVLSLAENNGSYNVGFKNLMDWTSRIKGRKTWGEKPMLLLATSPGARGGASVLEAANNRFPYMGADIRGTFSLPSFYQNFDVVKGILNADLRADLVSIIHIATSLEIPDKV